MPIVNLRIKCIACGTEDRTFPCPHCAKYTCRDCLTALDEAGCEHKKRNILTSQKWD